LLLALNTDTELLSKEESGHTIFRPCFAHGATRNRTFGSGRRPAIALTLQVSAFVVEAADMVMLWIINESEGMDFARWWLET
jgi:hypothetical protein